MEELLELTEQLPLKRQQLQVQVQSLQVQVQNHQQKQQRQKKRQQQRQKKQQRQRRKRQQQEALIQVLAAEECPEQRGRRRIYEKENNINNFDDVVCWLW